MGNWAKAAFGRARYERVGIVLAGTNKPEFERKVLRLFDEVVSSKDSVYHLHLVRKGKKYYPVVSNVYGAPAMMDVLTEMHDGGCRTVLFVGYAYGGFKQNLPVGSVVLPTRSFHFDGIYSPFDASKTETTPNRELRALAKRVLEENGIEYYEGPHISVPAVSFQLPHANDRYKQIKPVALEMELASCCSRAREIGMRTAGILIISDNKSSGIDEEEKKESRLKSKYDVVSALVDNLRRFDLKPLKTKKEFNIDDHLAWVIEDPEDQTNVYRGRKRKKAIKKKSGRN